MKLNAKTACQWLAVPLVAIGIAACGDDSSTPAAAGPCDGGLDYPCAPQDEPGQGTRAECGDGILDVSDTTTEECDDGTHNGEKTSSCTSECKDQKCGDGEQGAGEACDDGNTTDGDGCQHDCALATCGDGVVDDGEECDDGNTMSNDGCSRTCVEESCGDGVVQSNTEECDNGPTNGDDGDNCTSDCQKDTCGNGQKGPGEACDDGNTVNDDDCTNDCALARCGDGVMQDGEECDDGNNSDRDACLSSCLLNVCGDGQRGPDEECDDGNNSNRDDCKNDCTLPTCGDGIIQPGEACDDGDQNADDAACSTTCALTSCGDGIVQGNEECDDGNRTNNDACSNNCLLATCGDGVLQADGPDGMPGTADDEECDDGNTSNGDTCTNACTNAVCGDGYTQPGEACDDGNMDDNDGCNNSCGGTACGNGVVDPGEECDDGNIINDDACSNTCQMPTCGDGIFQANGADGMAGTADDEQCDDGNTDNSDTCLDTCMNQSCGDGAKGVGEGCDDGNNVDGDGCQADCSLPSCGDGVVDTGEACDDGNGVDTDGCRNNCTLPYCGDGVRQPDGPDGVAGTADDEQCDDGNASNTDACLTTCQDATCGDGYVQAGAEECDDGANNGPGMQCSGACTVSSCGDGMLDPDEDCDDGNTNNNDSCKTDCTWNECGDGAVYIQATNNQNPNSLEECDDGGNGDSDSCLDTCKYNRCGDNVVQQTVSEPYNDPDGTGIMTASRGGLNDPFHAQALVGTYSVPPSMLCPNNNQFAQCSPLPVHCPTAANALAECGSTPAPAGWPNLGQPGAALATINLAYIGNNPQAMAFGSLTNFVAPVEECDDGSASNTDSCVRRNIDGDGELECAFNFCGDGFAYDTVSDNTNPNATEQCDELLGSTNRANNGDSCIDTCQWNTCHDGWRYTAVSNAANTNGLEECDDGNTNDNDGCVDECVVATCGDAHVNYTAIGNDPWEECDDGNTTNTDACRNDCTRNPNTNGTCGDGIVQAAMGEECDDGNNAANSSCTPNCRWARCGDGVNYTNETDTTNPFEDPQDEDCDDGNFVAGGDQANDRDQCILGCKDADCGDGNLYTHDLTDTTGQHTALGNPEECDDGNDVATDGCNTTCALPECGDGVLDPGEECDDNNTTDGDGCQANCMLPVCGDGIADPGEGCDGADLGGTCTGGANAGEVCGFNSQCPGGTCTVNLLAGTFCEANCELSSCGNNTTDPGEDCDDGNDSPNDTCNHCRDVFCGDGILQKDGRDGIPNTGDDEQCDDGDADPTDSCLPNCKWNTCGDGVRLETIDANAPSFQTTTEMCDSGTLYSAHVNDDLNNGNPDDDYTDSAGLCNSACQIQCFANQGAGGGATPGNYWGTLWKGGTACVFVAEPYASTGGTAYDPYYGGFDDARDHCMGYGIPGIDLVDLTGGNLTQLNTQVDTLLQNAYTNNAGGPGTARAYLGLFDDAPANLDPPGTWSWLRTDTPLDPLNTNWAIGRPNDTNGTEDCGTIGRADGFLPGGTGTAGQWDDVPCTQTWRSVCEFPWPVGAP